MELVSKARFLFGKQILEDHADASLPEQLYCAIQTLYVGQPSEAGPARSRVDALLDRIDMDGDTEIPSRHIASLLDRGELYAALKMLRNMTRSPDSGKQSDCQPEETLS